MPDREVKDHDLWKLGTTENSPYVEIVINDDDDRIGLRLMNRFGFGILIERHEAQELIHIINATMRASKNT